ncbi:MAG: type II and III secretion system protein family protein [bacterium]
MIHKQKGIMLLMEVIVFVLMYVCFEQNKVYADQNIISLVQGQSRVIEQSNISKVGIGDATVASVKVINSNQLMITGISKGITNLSVWLVSGRKVEYTIRVTEEDIKLVVYDVRELLHDVEGVKVDIIGNRIVLEGQVIKADDYEKVEKIMALYPQVINFAKKNNVRLDKMVQIDVKMMEVDKGFAKNIGIGWPQTIPLSAQFRGTYPASDGQPRIGVFSISGSILSDFSFVFNLMIANNLGRVLSNPMLVCRSGDQASFVAGGEIPIPTTSTLGQTNVNWKEFGVILNIQPVTDEFNNISLKIHAETSDIDMANAVSANGINLPAFVTRKTETVVNLVQGETLVLSELLSDKGFKSVAKFPVIGSVPIIGELFKSRKYQQSQSQFLVFITPTIIRPGSIDTTRVKDMNKKYNDTDKSLGYDPLD